VSSPLGLIVGIGNPGQQYAETRHNAGVWFVEKLAAYYHGDFREEKKFYGSVSSINTHGRELKILIPHAYMNESGKAVGALVNFYKIPLTRILIVHDELDLAAGVVRLKQGGGLAGHNGLKHISKCLSGSREFNRLRIGVGRPDYGSDITEYVLGKPSPSEKAKIDASIDIALKMLSLMMNGDWQQAMTCLNTAPKQEKL
tara:strand:- start:1090 stop:1689 length:600 start_codon:yes stop_codon:yes gene_type:complete